MPVYSIKEFAKLTGKEPKHIHTYISRDKIIKNQNKQIDTTNPINLEFFEANKIDLTTIKQSNTTKPKNGKSKTSQEKEISPNNHQLVISIKQQLDIDLKKVQLEKDEIELNKLRGELISYDKAVNISKMFSEAMRKSMDRNVKRLVQNICTRHNIDNTKTAKYKTDVSNIVNKATIESIDLLKKEFKNG